jgi:EAL and modified HD-GYP domain-containing signal transduction protein
MSHQEILLARQPILDRERVVVAYELLFRNAEWAPELRPEGDAGDRATSQVLLNAFEELDIAAVTGEQPAYVNFTRQLILNPPPFDHERIVIEVLEDVEVDDLLLAKLGSLRAQGYTIALDDFVYRPELEALVQLADVIKIDIRAHDDAALVAQLGLVRRSGLRLLAEKVETNAEFERCRELGFDYFQGYFFARPEQLSGRRMPASRLSVLRLVAALQAPDATFEQVRDVIAADPPLSFKLLKLVNSAALRGGSEITSLQAAVALLGLDRVRSWASLLALSKLTDKSPALSVTTLVRAHLCEAVGRSALQGAPAEDYFIAGLLSTIDAYFDRTMAEVVKELPVAAPIQRALVRHGGKLGAILRACIDYERGAFEAIRWWELEALGITPQLLEAHYREALRVADIAANLLGEASH